jgi:nucleoid-associated protein YgaU
MGIASNNSRYFGQTVVSVITPTGTSSAIFGPSMPPIPDFVYYTVVAGDRLDTLAQRIYGSPDFWWKIADANPEIFYPDNLVMGSIIRIPTS